MTSTKTMSDEDELLNSSAPELAVVGIGASAGGLEALRTIFSHFDEIDSACFIVVQHMSPTSKSMLVDLLSRETGLVVQEAENGAPMRAGVVYVTPPNVDIILHERRIKLTLLENRAGPKPSIDRFLISLAEQFGEFAVACIVSGTGSDGAQGAITVKRAGGVVIAQTPASAKYDGMPRATLATGSVDLTLSPDDIAKELKQITRRIVEHVSVFESEFSEEPYKAIMALLTRKTKINFNLYKPKTINRRLKRRMDTVKLTSLDAYLNYLKNEPDEIKKLFQDILISVTSFFRDAEQFDTIQKHLTNYLAAERPDPAVRIWSAGCATGEEPYSLAILALEAIENLKMEDRYTRIQIFATDISENAMTAARRGLFSDTAVEGLHPDLLKKYFTKCEEGYQISKKVRDLVLFARHDLTVDPPFLKMDLISCRNLFIYLEQEVQEKILKIFHYALKPDGLLFMGKSESVGNQKSYFHSLDNQSKIFQRANRAPDPAISFTRLHTSADEVRLPDAYGRRKDRAVVERELIRDFCPNALVLDEEFHVTAVYGDAGKYLTFPDGPMEQKADGLVHPKIRNSFMTLAHRCRRSNSITKTGPISFDNASSRRFLQLEAYPVRAFGEPKIVVAITDLETTDAAEPSSGHERNAHSEELERELAATREHLQTVIEEQETSNEELQALNEELQSANEELQSTNEELETSNEELQSTNEELITLNEELNLKSSELAELSNHLQIVQNAVRNPILVVDKEFRLRRANDIAISTFGLSTWQGKNLRLIDTSYDMAPVFDVMEDCLRTEEPKSTTYASVDQDFDVYCQPICNERGAIQGVVATLVNNTEIAAALRKAENTERTLFKILDGVPAKVSVKDIQGKYTFANPTFCTTVGLAKENIIGRTDADLFGADLGHQRRDRDFEALRENSVVYSDEAHPVTGTENRIFHTARVPLVDEKGEVNAICSVGVDISQRAMTEKKLQAFQNAIATAAEDCFAMLDVDQENITPSFSSDTLSQLCELSKEELSRKDLSEIISCVAPNLPRQTVQSYCERIASQSKCSLQLMGEKSGEKRFFDLNTYRLGEGAENKIFMILFDVTKERVREEQLRKQEEEVVKAGKLASLGEMAAGIAHELKTPLNTIQGYVDLINELQSQEETVSAPVQDALAQIEKTVTNISDIIVGLKAVSRSSAEEEWTERSIKSIIEDVTRICSFHLKNRAIKFEVDLPDRDLKIEAKATQIVQVLINLINNAVDAVKGASEQWVRLEVKEQGQNLTIRVIDSGPGIPEPVLKQIMTPFFTTKKSGTGLGLSLSRNIAKLHNGKLAIDQSCPQTCFAITLPKKQPRSSDQLTH